MDDRTDEPRPFSTVAVRGEGMVEVVPDEARLIVTVRHDARTRDAALDDVRQRLAHLDRLLDEVGVLDDARGSTVRVGERGERDGNRWLSKGFRATATIEVTVDSVDGLGRIVSGAVHAADAEIAGPWWSLSRHHPALTQACTEAAVDARAKATAYAQGLGATLGEVVRVVEPGVRTISPIDEREPRPQSQAMVAAAAAPAARGGGRAPEILPELDLSPGKHQVRASVEVMFRLEPDASTA